jgi:hypothetical protein
VIAKALAGAEEAGMDELAFFDAEGSEVDASALNDGETVFDGEGNEYVFVADVLAPGL